MNCEVVHLHLQKITISRCLYLTIFPVCTSRIRLLRQCLRRYMVQAYISYN